MTRLSVTLFCWALVWLPAAQVAAQDSPAQDPPAHISFVDGAAVLERDGRTDSDLQSMPLLAGDRIRTQGGRLEVLFADASALHVDANTVVDFQSDEVVRILEGRIRLSVAGPARNLSYRVDAPAAWVQIADPGEYRIAVLRDGEVELAVLRGTAELVNEQGRSYIRAGERTFARTGAAPSPPYVFNSAAWDAFDRWSEARRNQRLGISAQYLPNDVRPYSPVFDSYGSWQYEQVYGYVWYPRVQIGWRPYHHGRWVSVRPYGWTWIAGDPWGWPTHHYGRWGFSGGAWFWIPGRTWGPAWVSWAYAPGYVSWCPLGWNDRPVLQIVNVYGRRYNPWDAWTVVPRHHFGGTYVNVRSVASVRIDQRVQGSFVVGNTAPEVRYAVGRNAAPIRTVGRYAVPRPGSYGATLAADPAGDRASSAGAERRFPAAARPPRAPTAAGTDRTAQTDANASRAVSRDLGSFAGDPSTSSRRAGSRALTSDAAVPTYRTPEGIRQRSETAGDPGVAVTAPPAGAVRAVPRMRDSTDYPVSGNRSESGDRVGQSRSRSYPVVPTPSSPGYSSETSVPTPRSSPEIPRYREEPAYRSGPDSGGGYRSRSSREDAPAPPAAPPRDEQPSPRSQPPPSYRSAPESSPPSYRSVPEGRAPGPSSQAPSRSGGDRGGGDGGGGGVRQRSGDSAPAGSAVRRRQ